MGESHLREERDDDPEISNIRKQLPPLGLKDKGEKDVTEAVWEFYVWYANSFLLFHPSPTGDFHWQSLIRNLIWVKHSSLSWRRQRKVHNEFGGTNQI